MRSLPLVCVVLAVTGCAQRPYTSQREALEARLGKLKAAEVSGRKALAARPSTVKPAKPASPITLEGPKQGGNALLTPLEEMALLETADLDFVRTGQTQNMRSEREFHTWVVASGFAISCVAEATRVLAKGDCGDQACSGDRSKACAGWLLGLEHVVFVETLVNSDRLHKKGLFSPVEEFKGRAVIVAVETGAVIDVIPFSGTKATGSTDQKVRGSEVQSAFGPALQQLHESLASRFPGTPAPSGFAVFIGDAKR